MTTTSSPGFAAGEFQMLMNNANAGKKIFTG
jgi:hypothetical protein